MSNAGSGRPTLAYIAGEFPRVSETFVYREVRGLRKRGWRVATVSLNPTEKAPPEMDDLTANRMVVYAGGSTMGAALAEIVTHPVHAITTLAGAVGDAINPGERLSLVGRMKLPLQAVAGIGLARRMRNVGVRHIHCHFAHAPTTVGMYAATQMNVSFSFTGHANDIFQRRALLGKKLRRAKFVACISQWHRDFYDSIARDETGKYAVVRCGVDPAPALQHVSEGENSNGPFKVLSVCRLVEKKGVDTLLSGGEELLQRGVSVRLMIAGDGPDRPRLEDIAKDMAVEVDWLGAVPNERVFCLLNEADVFALPCREDSRGDRDGIPVVLMEAMASGVPVVSGDLPAIRELVEDGKNGMLVEGNNPVLLADKLAALLGNKELRHSLAAEGRKKIASEFSLELNLDRLEKRFAEVTA